jgi:transposase-like protein
MLWLAEPNRATEDEQDRVDQMVRRMKSCESVDELPKELGATRRCLYKWRTKLEAAEPGEEAARPSTHASAQRKKFSC